MTAAAFYERYRVKAELPAEHIFEVVRIFLNMKLFVLVKRYDKEAHAVAEVRVNGEFVVIDHRKHSIEVHEAAVFGDIYSDDLFETGTLVRVKYFFRVLLDSKRLSPFRNSDCNSFLVKDKDITALDSRVTCAAYSLASCIISRSRVCDAACEPDRDIFVFRVVSEYIVAKKRLAVSRHCRHAVDGNAIACACKRVARKIQVRHRVDEERVVLLKVVSQIFAGVLRDIRFSDA